MAARIRVGTLERVDMLCSNTRKRQSWLMVFCVALLGFGAGSGSFAQAQPGGGSPIPGDQVFHDRFEGPPNEAPLIEPIPDQMIAALSPFSYQVIATDPAPPGDVLRYGLGVAPTGMSIDAQGGLISWTPAEEQIGKHPVLVRVSDLFGGVAVEGFEIRVLDPKNRAPSLEPIADRSIRVGQVLSIRPVASDPDLPDDVLSFSLEGAPAGLSLARASGLMTWAPTEAQIGDWPLTVTVTDLAGLSDSASFTVTVTGLGSPPSIQAIPDQSLLVGEALDITVQATDPDLPDDQLTFSLPRAPQGMSINADSGRITWTPGANRVGAHDVSVQVTDQIGLLDFTDFVVRVNLPNQAPVALNDEYRVRRGETLSVPAPGVMDNDFDPDGDPITAELLSGPTRGVLHEFNPDGSFSYSPGVPAAGAIEFAQVCDSGQDFGGQSTRYVEQYPLVIDLTGDGLPEIVWHAIGTPNNVVQMYAMRVVDGDCVLLWQTGAHGPFNQHPDYGVLWQDVPLAAGDVTGDGRPEIVAVVRTYPCSPQPCSGSPRPPFSHIALFDADGEFLWISDPIAAVGDFNQTVFLRDTVPYIADLTGDGRGEIVFGVTGGTMGGPSGTTASWVVAFRHVENPDGTLRGEVFFETRGTPSASGGGHHTAVHVVDLNLDGVPEILFENDVFSNTGQLLYSLPVPGSVGQTFNPNAAVPKTRSVIVNLDDDAYPEIVTKAGNGLYAFKHDGTEIWRRQVTGGGIDAPLTAADLTGDGWPEIAFQDSQDFHAYDRFGERLWTSEPRFVTTDRLGSTAFDFNGNGRKELVIARADRPGLVSTNLVVILDGRTGEVLVEVPSSDNNNFPQRQIPVVADATGDGLANLVVYRSSLTDRRVIILGGTEANPWGPARPIWNQSTYHVTNVNPDGTIPSPAQPHWLEPGLNNYHVNAVPVAERTGAVLNTSLQRIEINGIERTWYLQYGSVVAGDLTGDGRSELVGLGRIPALSGEAGIGQLVAMRLNDQGELEQLWNRRPSRSDPAEVDFATWLNVYEPALGDLDGDGVPEVVMPGYCQGEVLIFSNLGESLVSTQAGRVPLIGQSGSEFCDGPGTSLGLFGRVALVDLSGNGFPEIVTNVGRLLRVFATERDEDGRLSGASLLWESEAPGTQFSSATGWGFAIADVNLDARPNIWHGGALLDADGHLLWTKQASPSQRWFGFHAMANLDEDPFAELVFWGQSPGLMVLDHQGQCLWQARRTANPPEPGCALSTTMAGLNSNALARGLIIGDVAGDGVARILIGAQGATSNQTGPDFNRVLAYNPDGSLFWSAPTRLSNGEYVRVTHLNAFDLSGNGVMEVIATGAHGTLVLDGRNGQPIFELLADGTNPGEWHGTAGSDTHYSSVVDLDGDGAAELILASNVWPGSNGDRPSGVFVYRHPQNAWMPARSVWNQMPYTVTNVNEDLSIPSPAERNWLTRGLNNFGINAFMPGENGALDRLTYRVSDGELDSNEATVWIDIRRPNRPPTFISAPLTLAAVGVDYRYRVRAVDSDPGDQVTLSFNQGPVGMSFGADQMLRWQPGMADLGEHPIILSAIDLEGEISIQEFVLEVVEPVAVPDVLGLAQSDAEAALLAAGFVSGRISERFDEDFAAGLVAGQQPGAGSLQVPGTAIDLSVSIGSAPIDDSTPPEFPVEAIRIEPDAMSLLTGETVRLKAFAVFADGSTQLITRAVNWSSDSAAVSVNANGRILAASGGSATISAEIDGVVGQASVEVSARDPGDDEGPVALISAPISGQVALEPVEIIGTVFDEQLVRYELALSPAGQGSWTLLNQGISNVDGEVLGVFDPTVLLNGFYDIRLRVLDAGGNESTDEITVQADGEQKAGLFTLTFTDLSLPLGGLPITIERLYDSRDRSMGDFGVGWRLGLRSIELKCASRLGEDWFVGRSGLSFSLLPMREKTCAISLPGGRMEVFDFVVTPSVSPFVPFISVTGRLQPRSGTIGQLEIPGNTNFLILDQQPGEVWLYDDANFNPFNPVNFRYTMPDGTVFEFEHGQVSTVTDSNGNRLSFSLDGIEHSSGVGVDFERDTLGRITAITDPAGHTQTYTYGANGDLTAHTDVLGNTTRFFYNSRHGLVRIEDPLGNSAVRSEYDERGRLIALLDAAGNRTEHSYDDAARLKTTIFPDGSVRTVAYDERGNIEVQGQLVTIDGVPVFSERTWEYDDFGNPTRTVDADGVVEEAEWNDEREWRLRVIDPGGLNLVEEQGFDERGRVSRYTDALGRHRDYQYDTRGNVVFSPGPGGVDIGMAYDNGGRIAAVANPRGERSRLSYNTVGQVVARETVDAQGLVLSRTELVRDANGRVISQTEVPLAGEGAPRVTTFSHDALGRITSVVNPLGDTMSFEYDANGQNTAIIDALGARIEMDYDPRGLMVERRLPDGGIEQFDYDHAGRRTRHIDPDGVVHETEYDELGRAVAERVDGQLVMRRVLSPGGRVVAEIDALGQRIDHDHDSAGRLIRTRLPEVFDAVSASLQRPEIAFEYNAVGQRTAMIDPLGRRVEYVYDAAGYLSQVIHADGTSRQHDFDAAGRHLSVTDEEGHATLFDYDAAGRLVRIRQPATAPGEARPETRFSYDSFGQLRTRIDALGRVTAFEYDAAGRPVRTILPDGSAQTTEYDAAGRAVRVIDFDGRVLAFEHDAMGRILSRSAAGLVEAISYTPAGRRAQISDSRGLTSMSYDGQGRLQGFVEGDGLGIDYAYDANGRISSLTVAGQTTSYSWDALGRLASVTTAAGTTSYAYDLAGQLRSKTLPNGVVRQADYDLRGRPLSVELRGADNSLLESFVSAYSPRGKRLSVTTSDGSLESYVYDPIGRLVEAGRSGSDPFALSFEYDPVGNRLRQVLDGAETLYSYGPNHQLISAGGDTFSYDAGGNRTSAVVNGEALSYQWDAFGRMVGAVGPEGVAQFEYDIDNRRVARTLNGESTGMLIDPLSVSGFSQVVAEFDEQGQVLARWDFGRQVLSQHRAGQIRHYGHDHRGSVHLLSDGAGQVTDRYAYLPFGDLLSSSGSTPNPYRFNAERWEPAARSYDLRARSYDSCSGTFLSRDPFPGFQDRPFSLHPYQFGDADPINHIDPLGLFSLPELSLTQVIQNGLGSLNLLSAGATVCKARTAIDVANKVTAAAQITAFALNIYFGNVDVKVELAVPLGDGKKFKLELNPDFGLSFGNFAPSERGFTVKGEVDDGGIVSMAFGVTVSSKGISSIGQVGLPVKLAGIGVCGRDIGKFVVISELEAQVGAGGGGLFGKTSFTAKLALQFEEGLGGFFDSGGLEWKFLEISRASNEPPVNRFGL
ncbi:MAG: putative Ig domain-containing protein [Wenzhouxiangella sp.]